ncbi:MAG: glycosyltransferase [Syntrophomonadaceae bacterium]|nr:glycosyltransferase [Syntrophomonadaceae bacterium]
MSNISCILYPPSLDFNYLVQRPQHLMKSFSRLNVLSYYINWNSPDNPIRKNRGIERVNPYLYVFYDVDPKPYLANVRPVVYYTVPVHVETVQEYNPSLLVFDSVDQPTEEFEPWKPYYYRAVSSADLVLAASEKLYHMAKEINENTYLIPNGCDYDYFSQARSKNLPVPGDMQGIKRPIIGYMGVVATWCDLQLLEKLALRFPDASIVIVGPLFNVSGVPQYSNIHWLGFKPYEQLAGYLSLFDVGIIPFKMSSMIEAVNPIKLWEYMAAGIPVVTTNIPEIKKYKDLVLYSENEEEFMQNITTALYNDSPQKKDQRMALARENSWIERAKQIVGLIEAKLVEKGVSAENNPSLVRENIFYQGGLQTRDSFSAYLHKSVSDPKIKVSRKTSLKYCVHGGIETQQVLNSGIRQPVAPKTAFSGRRLNITGRPVFKYKTERINKVII